MWNLSLFRLRRLFSYQNGEESGFHDLYPASYRTFIVTSSLTILPNGGMNRIVSNVALGVVIIAQDILS